ncbi:hypothetical protein K1719_039807 [Acacia pycnantha]|nr:hypothetical protein K1719_039807 [Acacia pycnantha]
MASSSSSPPHPPLTSTPSSLLSLSNLRVAKTSSMSSFKVNNPIFVKLLNKSANEYGYKKKSHSPNPLYHTCTSSKHVLEALHLRPPLFLI